MVVAFDVYDSTVSLAVPLMRCEYAANDHNVLFVHRLIDEQNAMPLPGYRLKMVL